MDEVSLQDRYAPRSTCFGCGPANPAGLQIKSRVRGGDVVTEFRARPEHAAFPGYLNGGIAGTLIDCHANWTAVVHLMDRTGTRQPPSTVTSDLAIRFRRPIPIDTPVVLRGHVVESSDTRAVVEATLESRGNVCATGRATFVAVGPEHPAFGRW